MNSDFIAYCCKEYGRALERERMIYKFRKPEEPLYPLFPQAKRNIQVREDWRIERHFSDIIFVGPGLFSSYVVAGPLQENATIDNYVNRQAPETFVLNNYSGKGFNHLGWLARQQGLSFEFVQEETGMVKPGDGQSGGKKIKRDYFLVKCI